jgi:hypothetical protein
VSRESRWAPEFEASAAAYWTPERSLELTGGKSLLASVDRSAALLRAMGILHRDTSMPPPQRRKVF